MKTEDGSRRRRPGGVYFQLLRRRYPEELKAIYAAEKMGKAVFGQRDVVLDKNTGESMSLVWFAVDDVPMYLIVDSKNCTSSHEVSAEAEGSGIVEMGQQQKLTSVRVRFWALLEFNESWDMAKAFLHVPKNSFFSKPGMEVALENKLKRMIGTVCIRVNQQLLLLQLHDSKDCSEYLMESLKNSERVQPQSQSPRNGEENAIVSGDDIAGSANISVEQRAQLLQLHSEFMETWALRNNVRRARRASGVGRGPV